MTAFLRGVYAIVVLDLKRAWLDRARVLAGLAQPLLYLFVLGQGLGANSRMSGRGFLPFIFPGVIGLNLLMTSTMAAITIVFDRQIGFFKAVLVAPIPRSALALGKILSGAVQAFLQAALLLPFAPAVGITNPWAVLQLGCVMFFSATVFSSISVALAARFTSTTVFPIVNNAFVLPMFFLSGALYPLALAPHWMQLAAHCDPAAYAVDLMRGSVLPGPRFFPAVVSFAVLGCLFAALIGVAVRNFSKGEDDSILGAAHFRRR